MRTRLRVAAALVLACAFVAVPSTAMAATAAPDISRMGLPNPWPDDPPVSPGLGTPDGNRPVPSRARNFMLNILGSVLGRATPDSWQREQLAYQNRFNFGHETLEQMYNQRSASGMPDSANDYILREQQRNLAARGTSTVDGPNGATRVVGNGNRSRPPLTGSALLRDVAGKAIGVGGALTFAPLGFSLGWGLGGMLYETHGFDVNGAVCQGDPTTSQFLSIITQQPCPDVMAQTDEWREYVSTLNGVVGGPACNADRSYCFSLVGALPYLYFGNANAQYTAYCFSVTGPRPNATENAIRSSDNLYPLRSPHQAWSGHTGAGIAAPGTRGIQTAGEACGDQFPSLIGKGFALDSNWVAARIGTLYEYAVYNSSARTMGEAVTPEENGPDSMQALECTVITAEGRIFTQRTGEYRAGEGHMAVPMCPETPEGEVPQSVSLAEVGPNGRTEVYEQETTDAARDWLTQYPECSMGQCKLDLLYKQQDGTLRSCFDNETACADWFSDPNRSTQYQCRYGSRDVEQQECYAYAGIFQPGRVAAGAPYSDPLTGAWTGGQSSPEAGNSLMGQALQDPAHARNCWDRGWAAANPVEWVFTPVKCSLEWAFVPRSAVVGVHTVNMTTAWNGTPPAVLAGAVGGMAAGPSASGCRVDIPLFGTTLPVVNACPGSPLERLPQITQLAANVAMVVLVIGLIRRYVAGTVDYGANS